MGQARQISDRTDRHERVRDAGRCGGAALPRRSIRVTAAVSAAILLVPGIATVTHRKAVVEALVLLGTFRAARSAEEVLVDVRTRRLEALLLGPAAADPFGQRVHSALVLGACKRT
jgi:hypothetical protein